jgi:serine/threonine-protein kinase
VNRSESLIGKRLGDCEILALLALGGTAEIYLARMAGAAGFEKYVVVKCLHGHLADNPDFTRMFLDEARMGAQLDHSNIAQTLGLGEYEGYYYLIMEFVVGLSLAQIARKAHAVLPGGLLPEAVVLSLACQACAGLDYAHHRCSADGQPLNLVHRDISPHNLILTFDGVLKIVDFGIAKADGRETQTKTGTIKGKFAYMSPEQALAKPVDQRTDIFALGTLLHELLTGQRLFKRVTSYHTYQAVVEAHIPNISSLNGKIDPAVDSLIGRALAAEPEGRYPTAQAFGDAIQSYLHAKSSLLGSSDIADFMETHFQSDHTQHNQRMRELIAGQETATHAAAWDSDDIAEDVCLDTTTDGPAYGDTTAQNLTPTERRAGSELDAGWVEPEADEGDTVVQLSDSMEVSTQMLVSPANAPTKPGHRFASQQPAVSASPTPPQARRPSLASLAGIAALGMFLVFLLRWIFG